MAAVRSSKSPGFWIILVFAAIVIAAVPCVAIHIVVSGRLLRKWVNTDPEKLLLDYDAASSWIPGEIRIRGLRMRGSDPNVQWFFRMEKATISISLFDLLHKQFHATRVRAEGLVFHLREKQNKNALLAAHVARLPSIPGFSDPPLASPVEEPPALSEREKRRFWSVHVENLVADPTPDIWIEIYRFRGRARVTGGFLLRPHARVAIGPAAVEFLSGDFLLAPSEPMLSAASGRGDCVIDPHAPDEVAGQQIWSRISGGIRALGRIEDLRFLNHYLGPGPEPRLSGGGGQGHFDVRFDHGIGRGEADFEVGRATAQYKDGTLVGRASGRLAIPQWNVEQDDMEISGSRVELADITTTGTRHDERDWWGRFDIVSGRLHDGLSARTSLACRDARPLYTLVAVKLPGWAEGILKLEGVKGSARVRLASRLIDVEGLEVSGGKFHIAGNYRQKKDERRGVFLIETGPLAVGLAIDGPASHVKLLGARKWFKEEGK
jgi:hypothetical protein